jgi:hypothetical protein
MPLVLIGFGLYALGQRFGWFELNIGDVVANFWPLLLISFGLDLIFGRRRPWIGALLALVVFGGIVGTVAVLGTNFGAAPSTPQAFNDPRASVRSARVVFDGSASNVILNALAAEDPQLVEGALTANRASLQHEFSLDDGVATLELDSKQQGWFFLGPNQRDWDVALSPDVPLDLELNFSAVTVDADLRDLQISKANVELSAGEGTITLPDSATGTATISIDASAASLILVIPDGVEAQISADISASSLDIDPRFTKKENVYTTAGWATAKNRLDITLDASAASVEVR